ELSSSRDRSPVSVYAGWRKLSNRPTRGAFISRSGAGDCGGQGPRVVGRGLVIQGRMRALGVVVCGPGGNHGPRMVQVAEHGLVEQLIAHPTVEAFDETVLHRLARRDVVPFDPVLGTPLQDRVTGQFRAVVAD